MKKSIIELQQLLSSLELYKIEENNIIWNQLHSKLDNIKIGAFILAITSWIPLPSLILFLFGHIPEYPTLSIFIYSLISIGFTSFLSIKFCSYFCSKLEKKYLEKTDSNIYENIDSKLTEQFCFDILILLEKAMIEFDLNDSQKEYFLKIQDNIEKYYPKQRGSFVSLFKDLEDNLHSIAYNLYEHENTITFKNKFKEYKKEKNNEHLLEKNSSISNKIVSHL